MTYDHEPAKAVDTPDGKREERSADEARDGGAHAMRPSYRNEDDAYHDADSEDFPECAPESAHNPSIAPQGYTR